MQIAYEFLYDRPHVEGHTYLHQSQDQKGALNHSKATHDPAMLPSWEKAFVIARTTARLDGGLGNALLIHA
jgi:hypothetical protein